MEKIAFENATILITGATGLIGKALIRRIIVSYPSVNVVALVRNIDKARKQFKDIDCDRIKYVVGDVCDFTISDTNIDYIVHAASQTSSKMFVDAPVDTIMTALKGTENILNIAKNCDVKKVIYLSSMEVYGYPTTDDKIDEQASTNISTMSVRSCYPESKRMCESLCASYYSQYNVPSVVLRLTQTFGPGVEYNDGRVFAQFARSAIEGKDIILNTKGETKRCYLYTEDAVDAILIAMQYGIAGEAYNVANAQSYCSIYEMAKLVADECSDTDIKVIIEEKDISAMGYAPVLKMNLDTAKLQALGWKPQTSLKDMFINMINDMKN